MKSGEEVNHQGIVFKSVSDVSYFENLIKSGTWLLRESRQPGHLVVSETQYNDNTKTYHHTHYRVFFNHQTNQWERGDAKGEVIQGPNTQEAYEKLKKGLEINGFTFDKILLPLASEQSQTYTQYSVQKIYNNPVETLVKIEAYLQSLQGTNIKVEGKDFFDWLNKNQDKLTEFDKSISLSDLEDPIMFYPFKNPVILQSGRIVEKDYVLKEAETAGKKICPLTAIEIDPKLTINLNRYQVHLNRCENLFNQLKDPTQSSVLESAEDSKTINPEAQIQNQSNDREKLLNFLMSEQIKNKDNNHVYAFSSEREGSDFAEEILALGVGSIQLPGMPKTAHLDKNDGYYKVYLTENDLLSLIDTISQPDLKEKDKKEEDEEEEQEGEEESRLFDVKRLPHCNLKKQDLSRNYVYYFKKEKKANQFIDEIFKLGIGSVTSATPNKKTARQKMDNDCNHWVVFLTPEQERKLSLYITINTKPASQDLARFFKNAPLKVSIEEMAQKKWADIDDELKNALLDKASLNKNSDHDHKTYELYWNGLDQDTKIEILKEVNQDARSSMKI